MNTLVFPVTQPETRQEVGAFELRRHIDDEELMELYATFAGDADALVREGVRRVLETCSGRPVPIEEIADLNIVFLQQVFAAAIRRDDWKPRPRPSTAREADEYAKRAEQELWRFLNERRNARMIEAWALAESVSQPRAAHSVARPRERRPRARRSGSASRDGPSDRGDDDPDPSAPRSSRKEGDAELATESSRSSEGGAR